MYHPDICLEGLRKTTNNLIQDIWSPGRDLNQGPPEYEAGVETTRLRRSIVARGVMSETDFRLIIIFATESQRIFRN
jgi:hypothetical protein